MTRWFKCACCGVKFDMDKDDDSGFIGDKPYCAVCRPSILDYGFCMEHIDDETANPLYGVTANQE